MVSAKSCVKGVESTMKISVIMPCHNCGLWVQEALQSIAAQTYPAHEIIVINDNSTDDSDEQIAASGVPVKLLHTSFGNAAAARNEGIRQATGDWIALLDADDVWYTHHLSSAVEALQDRRECVAYLSHRIFFVGQDPTTPFGTANPLFEGSQPICKSADQFLKAFIPTRYFNHCGLVVRGDRFTEINGYDSKLLRRHDIDMFLRLIHGCDWIYDPRPGSAIRVDRLGRIAGNLGECNYYFLRAILKNEAAYTNAGIKQLIDRAARIALGQAMGERSAKYFNACWQLAYPRLSLLEKGMFMTRRLLPENLERLITNNLRMRIGKKSACH